MLRFGPLLAAVALLVVGPAALLGQEPATPIVDTILVEGNARLTQSQIVGTAGLVAHQPINYRDVQRAIGNLFRTGQFDDVLVEQRTAGDRLLLVFKVKERPVLERRKMALEFHPRARGGAKAIELRGVDKTFGDNIILLDARATIMNGERVGTCLGGTSRGRAGRPGRPGGSVIARVGPTSSAGALPAASSAEVFVSGSATCSSRNASPRSSGRSMVRLFP